MGLEQLPALLTNPNVAYLLLVLGLLGLIGEALSSGVAPGVLGVTCLVLALIGLGSLPTNWGGVVLILLAVALFLFDLKVPGHGLSVAGILIFLFGSLLLFTPPWLPTPVENAVRLSPWVMLGTTGGVSAFFLLGAAAALRARGAPVAVGKQTLLGKVGVVRRALQPAGIVHIDGEEWTAVAVGGGVVPVGAQVRVMATDGLTLRVEPLASETGLITQS